MIAFLRRKLAERRLQRITQATRNSFECERYRRNRAAQIKRGHA